MKKFQVLSFRFQDVAKGFTLVEVLVGSFLMLLVFLGIFGAFQLGLKVVSQSKARLTATAIANQKIEEVRNLPYQSIGVKGSFPEGVLEKLSTVLQNNIEFRIETRVDYVIDSADGISPPEDECPQDYKRVKIKVSWSGVLGGFVELSSDVTPENLAQECASEGGILSVSVFDAQGQMISLPLIEVKDPLTDQTLKTATPAEGKHYFSLASSTYKLVVSKESHSTERTYGTEEVTTPEKPHPIILEGKLTEMSFSIDKVSSFSVDTLSPWGMGVFADSFSDESKISQIFNLVVQEGKVNLAKENGEYKSEGFLVSQIISPENLIKWDKLYFTDNQPDLTEIKYQILYFDGENWVLVPNSDLSGNSEGFKISPIDLSGLSTANYSQLRLKGTFSTEDLTISPTLYDWQVSWQSSEPTPIPNAFFNLKGAKIIGKDSNENQVYKYSKNHISGPNGNINISNLEWDNYTFSVDPASGLDLVSTEPAPQPIGLSPNTNSVVKLYLEAENSLLISVQNNISLEPIFAAAVRLFNTELGYDITQYTNEKGQTYFIPLTPATYNLEVSAPGYSTTSTQVSVSGDTTKTVKLEQVE